MPQQTHLLLRYLQSYFCFHATTGCAAFFICTWTLAEQFSCLDYKLVRTCRKCCCLGWLLNQCWFPPTDQTRGSSLKYENNKDIHVWKKNEFCKQLQMKMKTKFLPMSSKRSTQTTKTFVSGPSGGKDFPLDDLFVFVNGLNCMKMCSSIKSE